ncbi:hypothetical protein C7974DRAFT_410738 [Boeremia exigua]|uniref:uncharacterized protein n=1 Tax=Boeremia exigua TaxID=749465 RepID=UPI001E8D97C6|nr:uncharacterized protein C7974DRAFT_410738 [Boeremia exigua]KAH6639786.1 hypothetical protein C7974DRAFT_410738 [Boeremia exigua]
MLSFLRSLCCLGSSPSSPTTPLPPPRPHAGPRPGPRPAALPAIAFLPVQTGRVPSALLVRRSLAGHPVPTNMTVTIPA